MARADLFNFGFDALPDWMLAVSDEMERTLLFVTHPTSGGSATDGPLFQLRPSQVVAIDLFTTSRHTKADASVGLGASSDHIQGVSIDPAGEPSLFTTTSGAAGTSHTDTNMRYLIPDVVTGSPNIGVEDNGSGSISADNVYPGIMVMPISEEDFLTVPTETVAIHDHTDSDGGGTLGNNAFLTDTESFAGASTGVEWVVFAMQPRAFFPMFHSDAGIGSFYLNGHNVDAASADSPRFGFWNLNDAAEVNYDVDYRFVDV